MDNFLSSLMLNYKEKVKKNISKICDYLSKMNKFRAEKTILGLVLVLSFPQVTQTEVSNLVGVSSVTLRNNLAIKNIKTNFGNAIGAHINTDLIFEYLEIIINAIQKNKIPQVEPRMLKGIIIKVHQIKTITHKIVRVLREKQLYKKEPLILAMAIYLSCPFINRFDTSEIIFSSLKKKVSCNQIEKFQKEISLQKMFVNNNFLRFKHLGRFLKERTTEVLCVECGNFIYEQLYQNKKIFVCKHYLESER